MADELHHIARLGDEVKQIMDSEAFQTGLTIVRGRIFEEWTGATTTDRREALHAEQRALERLLEAFKTLDDEGAVAREAIRQANTRVSQ
jgi:hypothetical protein